jgi:hypothetical protein
LQTALVQQQEERYCTKSKRRERQLQSYYSHLCYLRFQKMQASLDKRASRQDTSPAIQTVTAPAPRKGAVKKKAAPTPRVNKKVSTTANKRRSKSVVALSKPAILHGPPPRSSTRLSFEVQMLEALQESSQDQLPSDFKGSATSDRPLGAESRSTALTVPTDLTALAVPIALRVPKALSALAGPTDLTALCTVPRASHMARLPVESTMAKPLLPLPAPTPKCGKFPALPPPPPPELQMTEDAVDIEASDSDAEGCDWFS